jgi:hypothetical protein
VRPAYTIKDADLGLEMFNGSIVVKDFSDMTDYTVSIKEDYKNEKLKIYSGFVNNIDDQSY